MTHHEAEAQLLEKYARARLSVIAERSGDMTRDTRELRAEVEEYAAMWDVDAPDDELWEPYLHRFEEDA
jgi:hypothetical protein